MIVGKNLFGQPTKNDLEKLLLVNEMITPPVVS